MSANLKRDAAEAAMNWIKPGMKLGLGTGSTANELVQLIAAAVKDGLELVCVPTSIATYDLAKSLEVPLATLDEEPRLDLTIDGADEIDPSLNLVKGGGGAHLREKIVAKASREMIVIADESKVVDQLGAFPLPLEVTPFGLKATKNALEDVFSNNSLSGDLILRQKNGETFVTDNGNYIFDAHLKSIPNPKELAARLNNVVGLVEHGLFVDIAVAALVAGQDGVKTLTV